LENTKGFINKNKTDFSKKPKKEKKEKARHQEKKKAYHDDEMLQIRKINKRIRFDSDPRPMQQKTRNMETQGKEAERRRKESECAAAAACSRGKKAVTGCQPVTTPGTVSVPHAFAANDRLTPVDSLDTLRLEARQISVPVNRRTQPETVGWSEFACAYHQMLDSDCYALCTEFTLVYMI
jgi:hypothetical protein